MTDIELSRRIEEPAKINDASSQIKRKIRRRMQRIAKAQKDDALLRIICTAGYSPDIGYIDRDFNGTTLLHSGKYIKYPKNSNLQRWIKRATSKRYRKYLSLPRKGNHYRRLFDYWWTLY